MIPGIPPQQVPTRPVIAAGPRPRPAGVLPFRLGGLAIATQTQGIRLDLHTLRIHSNLVRLVALGQPLLSTEPVAVGGGIIPTDRMHRTFLVRMVLVSLDISEPGVLLHEPLILLDRHFLGGDGEPA